MDSSTASLIPCLVESLVISDVTGESGDNNPKLSQTKVRAFTDAEFNDHEQRWMEMCEEASFSSALRYLRTRMFLDRDMTVIVDETKVRQLALALYRYRSGDIDESIQDKDFMSSLFDWEESPIFSVLPEQFTNVESSLHQE
jgi:hypothetical protein